MAITVRNGSRAAYSSARALGITGPTGIGAITTDDPATMAGAGMNADGAATGIMTDGAIMMAGVAGSGTATADSMVTMDTGTDPFRN